MGDAKYFRILVALCEPRLRDPSTSRSPTVPEIMERLPDLGLSRTAIGFHIGYLAEKKLHVKSPQSGPPHHPHGTTGRPRGTGLRGRVPRDATR